MAQLAGEGHVDLLIQEGYTHMYKKIPRKGFAIGMAGIKHRIDRPANMVPSNVTW
ncbi:MAG: hypothetical protein CM1200mP2_59140 [Planctomycetaceae bacterium]|nr:MAG: hypothetical protein CM1200mP2_59140 [Planctomycetaceae bacterium]